MPKKMTLCHRALPLQRACTAINLLSALLRRRLAWHGELLFAMAPPQKPKKEDASEEKEEALGSLAEEGASDGPKLAKAESEKKQGREQCHQSALSSFGPWQSQE